MKLLDFINSLSYKINQISELNISIDFMPWAGLYSLVTDPNS